LGSLGFLTPFKFDNFQQQVTNVLEGHAALTLRSRLRCIIVRKNEDKEKPPPNLLVLNEVVIDRGPSPYLSNIDLFFGRKIHNICPRRRFDCVNTDRKYGVCGRSWCVNDSSECSSHHGDANMSSFFVFQANSSASRC